MKELKFTREELEWIQSYVEASAQTMEALLNAYYPGAKPVWEKVAETKQIEVADPLVQAQLDHALGNGKPRRELANQLSDMLIRGLMERDRLGQTRKELEEIVEHTRGHDDKAASLAMEQLEKLQKQEDYEIRGDISLFRLCFDAVDRYHESLAKVILPGYDTKPDDHFPNPMTPRIYYKNKAKKTLAFLDKLREKLQKVIV